MVASLVLQFVLLRGSVELDEVAPILRGAAPATPTERGTWRLIHDIAAATHHPVAAGSPQ